METVLVVHIAAGALALLAGYVALFSPKGIRLHRRSGMVFVYALLTMCAGGLFISLVHGAGLVVNGPAALLTSYLVVTSLVTLRPPAAGGRAVHVGLMLLGLAVGLTSLAFGFKALASPGHQIDGIPAFRSSCSAWSEPSPASRTSGCCARAPGPEAAGSRGISGA